jgi:hypothetical protein
VCGGGRHGGSERWRVQECFRDRQEARWPLNSPAAAHKWQEDRVGDICGVHQAGSKWNLSTSPSGLCLHPASSNQDTRCPARDMASHNLSTAGCIHSLWPVCVLRAGRSKDEPLGPLCRKSWMKCSRVHQSPVPSPLRRAGSGTTPPKPSQAGCHWEGQVLGQDPLQRPPVVGDGERKATPASPGRKGKCALLWSLGGSRCPPILQHQRSPGAEGGPHRKCSP